MPQRKWPIPNDWQDEDGYRLVLFCVPDSRQWRTIVTGLIEDLAYGRNWDEKTGVITDVQSIAREIFESLDMTCGEDIKRIADTLDKMYDSQFVNLDDLITVLPGGAEGKWGKWLEVMGEYKEALDYLIPGFTLQLPKIGIFEAIGTFIFRKRLVEGLNDIALQLKSLNVSTSGIGAKAILDELINLLPADELADWVLGDLDESISSISDGLLTTLTGNYMTNKLDDLVNSVNGGFPTSPALTGNYVTKRLADLRRTLDECCEHQTEVNVTINQAAPSDGVVSVGGEDDQFPDQPSYFNAKCSAANGVFDTMAAFIDDLAGTDLELMTSGVTGGVISALSYKLTQAGVLGWAISKVSSFVTGIAMKLLGGETISFSNIAAALSEQHEPLVLALYNASNAAGAKSSFMTVLGQAATSLTATESGLVSDLLTYDLLNQLFSPRSDTVAYQSSDPVDCTSGGTVWTFDTGEQGWAFRDDSDGTASASGVHVPAREAWELSMDPDGGTAWGVIYLNGLSIAVDIGNSVQYDFSAPSDGQPSSIDLKVIYSDLSEFLVYGDYTGAGTMILSITEAGTIETIECLIGRQIGGGDYTQDVEEVRVQ